jgi:hypothetical protein
VVDKLAVGQRFVVDKVALGQRFVVDKVTLGQRFVVDKLAVGQRFVVDKVALGQRFVVDKVALGQIFLQVLRFSLVSNTPAIPHNHFYVSTILTRRTTGRSLGTYKRQCSFEYRRAKSNFHGVFFE